MPSRGGTAPRSRPGSRTSASRGSPPPSSASPRPTPSWDTLPTWKTSSSRRSKTSRVRCASCMRSKAALAYSLLFFWSGATALVYELLWIRLLYQAFGSTIQSVTTVVAAYMGGLGLGAWLLGSRGDRHPRPAALYGWLEIAIGCFGLASPFVFELVSRVYVAVGGALRLEGAASMLLRFGLAGLALLVPTTLMGGTLPVLTRAFAAGDRVALRRAGASLYGLNTLRAMIRTALAGVFLVEYVGIPISLWL